MANFKKNTRYTNGLVDTNRSEEKFLVLRQPLSLEQSSDDIFVNLTQDDARRPDIISQKAYNTTDLWWVIAEYNNISDPLFQLTAGLTIRIPQLVRVLEAIKNLGTK